MSHMVRKGFILTCMCITFLFAHTVWGQSTSESESDSSTVLSDELQRETPRSTVEGFLLAARDRDYVRAANYLDLSYLPQSERTKNGPEFAQQLHIVFERALWSNLDVLSDAPEGRKDDGLPDFQELVGKINFEEQGFDIFLHRTAADDGGFFWQFSAATVAELPEIYEQIGYGFFGELASKITPNVEIFGAPLWQIATLVMLALVAYLMALGIINLLRRFIRRGTAEQRERRQKYLAGPVRFFLTVVILRLLVMNSASWTLMRVVLQAETLLIFGAVWACLRTGDLLLDPLIDRLRQREQETTILLLRQLEKFLRALLILGGVVMWFDNLGFKVTTLLTGVGLGGAALALAAQSMLKNIFGNVMILLDKPFSVGHRVIVAGYDGIIEEIGVRSTKLRLLNGHQVILPNEEMAQTNIENISRRPYIRHKADIKLAPENSLEQVERAVEIIRSILDQHEGMKPELPPRVYLTGFNDDSFNVLMMYWYHPADLWAFYAFNHDVNVRITHAFEQEGIEFAWPSITNFLEHHEEKSL